MPAPSPHAWRRWTLPAIAVGGMAGALARHGLELLWTAPDGGVPWATLAANVSGSLLIGVLMVAVLERRASHPLLRPFVGVGLLGGFTTFSTYAVQTHLLVAGGRPVVGLGYLAGTLAAALVAVAVGVALGRAARRLRHRLGTHAGGSR